MRHRLYSNILSAPAKLFLASGFFVGVDFVRAEPAPFAVVELFTSEGCSSCPPADRLLSQLMQEADRKGEKVFALSFHVDYWNYLGWADPFSRSEYSERQQRYAQALESRTYTPQMIVNGTAEFVGSDADAARDRIARAMRRGAETEIEAEAKVEPQAMAGADGSKETSALRNLHVKYRVIGHPGGSLVNLALVEKGVSVPVRRGENGGRTLRHDNVVRAFASVRPDAAGRGNAVLPIPPEVDLARSSLIAYVQDQGNLEVTGAAQVPVN